MSGRTVAKGHAGIQVNLSAPAGATSRVAMAANRRGRQAVTAEQILPI